MKRHHQDHVDPNAPMHILRTLQKKLRRQRNKRHKIFLSDLNGTPSKSADSSTKPQLTSREEHAEKTAEGTHVKPDSLTRLPPEVRKKTSVSRPHKRIEKAMRELE